MIFNPFAVAKRLRKIGLVGINQRNADYVLRYNQRKFYPRVDDKLLTKKLAIEHGLPVPELYAVVAEEHEIEEVHAKLQNRDSFVVKPAHGSGGDGILVISGRRGSKYRRSSGNLMSAEDFNHHISNALSGLFSLGGQPDKVLIEYCVQFDPIFDHVSYRGVPDVRIIVFQGYPVMAMIRLPTRQSDGKANLHKGAVGVGLDICTGRSLHAVQYSRRVYNHPDTGLALDRIAIPDWKDLLLLAARSFEMTRLGYIGVDLVIDAQRGPLLLELNARPGLAIQIANGQGLLPRLRTIEALDPDFSPGPEERVAFAMQVFG